jgi:hypothetical protein
MIKPRVSNMTATLKAHARISFSSAAAQLIETATAQLPVLPYVPKESVELDLLIRPDIQRITISQKGRSTSTFVFRSTGIHSFWDHDLRGFVDLPQGGLFTQIQPPEGISVKAIPGRQRGVVEMSITDAKFGIIRHELEFDKRKELQPFAAALFYTLHGGPRCHATSKLPLSYLVEHGCVISERTFIGSSQTAAVVAQLEDLKIIELDDQELRPPQDFAPLERILKEGRKEHSQPKNKRRETKRAEQSQPTKPQATAPKQEDVIGTPVPQFTCFSSSRSASITLTMHQDFLDNLLNNPNSILNTAASLLGTATLDPSGTITLPWLATLAGIAPTAAGSGIFCFLREPRIPSTMPGGPAGGHGLVDRLTVQALRPTKQEKMTRFELEFINHTLAGTLTALGISSTTAADLISAQGNLWDPIHVTDDERIEVLEAFEKLAVGIKSVGGIPTSLPPFVWSPGGVPIFDVGVTNIMGNVDFSTIAGGKLIPNATIGPSGDVAITITLPTISVSGLVFAFLEPAGWAVLGGSVVGCILLWGSCPATIALVALIIFVMNNLVGINVLCTGVSLALDIQWSFNSSTNRLDPFVTLVSTSGTVDVTTVWIVPNIIGNLFLSIITELLDLFNTWTGILTQTLTTKLQGWLQDKGFLSFPPPGMDLQASAGTASSMPSTLLLLQSTLTPVGQTLFSPNATQVELPSNAAILLRSNHLIMRNAINSSATTTTPPTISAGTYLGLAVDQNALNYFIFVRWLHGEFSVDIADPTLISKIISLAPLGSFTRPVNLIRISPTLPPRLEVSLGDIVDGSQPLLAYFDEVRACFAFGNDPRSELSFNIKTTGTLAFTWPTIFNLLFDTGASAVPSEIRGWEFVDLSNFTVMNTITPNDLWLPLVNELVLQFLPSPSGPGLVAPPFPLAWPRALPAMQQELLPFVPPASGLTQDLYMEILGLRRVLYLLPVLRCDLLGYFDGSSGKNVGNLGLPVAPNIAALKCAQGKSLTQHVPGISVIDILDTIGLNNVVP